MDPLTFSASEVILGVGILGLYGFVYKIDLGARKRSKALVAELRSVATEVNCLKALHLNRHPEDKGLFEEVCKETPT